MYDLILTYAIVNSFRRKEKDTFECFYPVILDSMDEGRVYNFPDDIYGLIKTEYGLHIPRHPLFLILSDLKQNEYLDGNSINRKWKFEITARGVKYVADYQRTKHALQKQIDVLLSTIHEFVVTQLDGNKLSIELTQEVTKEVLTYFIRQHLIQFIDFINPKKRYYANDFEIIQNESEEGETSIEDKQIIYKIFIKFIVVTKEHNPDLYQQFLDLVLGSLIVASLYSEESIVAKINSGIFSGTKAYLDTNLILSIFNLRPKGLNEASQELLEYLHEFKIKVAVLDFTLNELSNTLKPYRSWYIDQEKKHPLASLFKSLAEKGYTPDTLDYFVDDIKNSLESKQITIEETDTLLTSFKPSDPEKLGILNDIKGEKSSNRHDIAAIEHVIAERKMVLKDKVVNFSNIPSFFLSADRKLYEFNFEKCGHREKKTIAEVFFDQNFMSLLWLSKPKKGPSVEMIIINYLQNTSGSRIDIINTCADLEKVDMETVRNTIIFSRLFPNVPIIQEIPPKPPAERVPTGPVVDPDPPVNPAPTLILNLIGIIFILLYLIIILILQLTQTLQSLLPYVGLVVIPLAYWGFVKNFLYKRVISEKS